jgi:hypothetical protein
MERFLLDFGGALVWVVAESAPYLLFGFLLAGLLNRWVSAERIHRAVGKPTFGSVLMGAVFGAPLPLCSCGVAPSAISLRRRGASRGATLSFLISTPETDVTSLAITWALMDPLLALARPVAAVFTAIMAGVAANLVDRGESPASACVTADPGGHGSHAGHGPHGGHETAAAGCGCEGHSCSTEEGSRRRVLDYAFRELFDDISWWLLLSFVLAGVILVLVPDSLFASGWGSGWQAMLLMLVLGVPLYMCATSSTPIAAAMVLKGLSPGAALVFLLSGPATNAASLLLIARFIGKRATVIYLASIAAGSILFGVALNQLYAAWGLDPRITMASATELLPAWVEWVAAGLLVVLMVRSFFRVGPPPTIAVLRRRLAQRYGQPRADRLLWGGFATACLAFYLLSGLYLLRPGETAVERTLGRTVEEVRGPGLYWHWPFPIQRHKVVDAETSQELGPGFTNAREVVAPQERRGLCPMPPAAAVVARAWRARRLRSGASRPGGGGRQWLARPDERRKGWLPSALTGARGALQEERWALQRAWPGISPHV